MKKKLPTLKRRTLAYSVPKAIARITEEQPHLFYSRLQDLASDGAKVELHISEDPMQQCACIVSDASWIKTYPRNQIFRGATLLAAVGTAAEVKYVLTHQR